MKTGNSLLKGVAILTMLQIVVSMLSLPLATFFGGGTYIDGPNRLLDAALFLLVFSGQAGLIASDMTHSDILLYVFFLMNSIMNAFIIWTPVYLLRRRDLGQAGRHNP